MWLYVFCEEVFSNSVNIPNFITFCLSIKTINSHWYLKFQFSTTEVVPFFSFLYLFFHSLSDKKLGFCYPLYAYYLIKWLSTQPSLSFQLPQAGLLTLSGHQPWHCIVSYMDSFSPLGQPLIPESATNSFNTLSALYSSRNGREERGLKIERKNKRKCVKQGYLAYLHLYQ